MKSNDILYSKGLNDECYTPEYAVTPILKHLKLFSHRFIRSEIIIWCPFDKENSFFVKCLKEHGWKVIHSHKDEGKDFYNYEPDNWDVIISNPPFTNKRKIFERALSFNKPFALIMSLTWLNDSAPCDLFLEKDLQLLKFNKRIKFLKPDGTSENKVTFSSAYYCYDFLPKQIIMEKLITK